MVTTPIRQLLRVARSQHSLFTAAQADEVGVASSTLQGWVAAGRVHRWYRGVYALAGIADGWHRRARAATLAVPGTVVAGEAAAYLHRFLDAGPADIVLLGARRTKAGGVNVRLRTSVTFGPADVAVVDGTPVTSAPRTIVDLAALLPADRLQRTLVDAWRRGVTSPTEVGARLAAVGRVRGAANLRAALATCHPAVVDTRSIAEAVGVLAVIEAGLPEPRANHEVVTDGGRYLIDLAWPDLNFGIEVDGRTFHSLPPDRAADTRREAHLRRAGWTIDRAPATLVLTDPARFARGVRAALAEARTRARIEARASVSAGTPS